MLNMIQWKRNFVYMLEIQSRVKSQKNEMRAILIFDHLNDVLFVKCNKKFASHILKLAKMQGLLGDDKVDNFEV